MHFIIHAWPLLSLKGQLVLGLLFSGEKFKLAITRINSCSKDCYTSFITRETALQLCSDKSA